jgi:hypothetical protein
MVLESYDKYEYMWPNLSGLTIKGILDKFNKLGQEGWEVISFSLDNYQALLKRKITVTKV